MQHPPVAAAAAAAAVAAQQDQPFDRHETARILIRDGSLIDSNGRITAREMRVLRAWCLQHRRALMDNWNRAREAQPLKKVEGEP